jgi:hypothetical protein
MSDSTILVQRDRGLNARTIVAHPKQRISRSEVPSQRRIRLLDRRYGYEPDRIKVHSILVPPLLQSHRRRIRLSSIRTTSTSVRVGCHRRVLPPSFPALFVQELNRRLVSQRKQWRWSRRSIGDIVRVHSLGLGFRAVSCRTRADDVSRTFTWWHGLTEANVADSYPNPLAMTLGSCDE